MVMYIAPSLQAAESEQCPSFTAAMRAGEPVYTKSYPSLADGLAVPKVRLINCPSQLRDVGGRGCPSQLAA